MDGGGGLSCGNRLGVASRSTVNQVLSGVRVLDFGRHIAAPWCAALLGDLGAEVIRIERQGGGEDRWITPLGGTTGDGATFLQCNRNKRSITLDPKTPEGAEITRKLVATADVLIVNLPEATLCDLGLDYASVRAIKPDIVFANGTAYGVGGPYGERVGYDGIGQVMSGAVYRSGTPDAPMRCAVPYADFGTALNLAVGVMAALFHRNKTGQGQRVDGALLATALMMSNAMLMEQAILKVDRVAIGNRGYAAAPSDLLRVKDGWILVQIVGQPQFKRWCHMVGEEQWLADPRFADDEKRGIHRGILNDRMSEWCATRTKAEALAQLDKARIPAASLYSPQQALDDPHVQAMGYYKMMEYPGLTEAAPVMETPFRLSLTPGEIRRRAPLVGEHTDEILGSLGYDADKIADLRRRHAI
jgi:crotonobetainyl-CoA:carnitine CoA-transferase CaiB-like acyl-CoA transferase